MWCHQCRNSAPILLYRTFPHTAHYTVRVLVSFSVGHFGTGCDRQAHQPGRNPATTPCSRTAQGKQTSQTPQEGYLCIANQPPALSVSALPHRAKVWCYVFVINGNQIILLILAYHGFTAESWHFKCNHRYLEIVCRSSILGKVI